MNGVKLFHCDCMEILDKIKDESINMILCDLPYGGVQRAISGIKD